LTRFEYYRDLATFLWRCRLAYRQAVLDDQQVTYFSVTRYGVPRTSILIGHGRAAWQISDFATRYFAVRQSEGGRS
jgi:hypothetical protein